MSRFKAFDNCPVKGCDALIEHVVIHPSAYIFLSCEKCRVIWGGYDAWQGRHPNGVFNLKEIATYLGCSTAKVQAIFAGRQKPQKKDAEIMARRFLKPYNFWMTAKPHQIKHAIMTMGLRPRKEMR